MTATLGPRRQPALRRARPRHGVQRRTRAWRHARPVRALERPAAGGAGTAVGRQCQRRPIDGHHRRRAVRGTAGQPRHHAAGRGTERVARRLRHAGRDGVRWTRWTAQLERLGHGVRRRAVAQRRSGDGQQRRPADDRRRRLRRRLSRRPADAFGHRRRPQRLQLLGRRHRRQRPRHRRACRPLWPARLAERLRQRRTGLQPLRRQRHPADQRHRHDRRPAKSYGDLQPARRPRRNRPALRGRAASRAARSG